MFRGPEKVFAMHDIGLLKRIYYNYLGYLYWFTHYTSTHSFLGVRFSTVVKLSAIGLVLAAWIYDWGQIALFIALGLLFWIFLAYWRARRSGYFKFIAGEPAHFDSLVYEKLPPYKRVSCIATGVFSVKDWEKHVLLRPAAYWQAPRGDHGLMVEHEPRRYLYQFFNAAKMQDLQCGWLLYGAHALPALSIRFLSIWGPEFAQEQYSIFGSEPKPAEAKPRTIYISFSTDEEAEIISHNILRDIQQYNLKKETTKSTN
jgi:hypothetical protein